MTSEDISVTPLAPESSLQSMIFMFLISTLSAAIIAFIPPLVNENILQKFTQSSLYYLLIIVTLLFLSGYLYLKRWDEIKLGLANLRKSRRFLPLMIIWYIVVLFIFFFVISQLFPAFQITSPSSGSSVSQKISVSGNGAIPGTPVFIWVIDDQGKSWPQGQATPTSQGGWTLDDVRIGRQETDIGKQFTIYARTQNDAGKEINSNNVLVERK